MTDFPVTREERPMNNVIHIPTRRQPMSYESIRVDVDAAAQVATITLNRPDKLNSFTRAMHRELAAALDEVVASKARALVLTGAGRGFCAGQDLADLDFTPGASTDLGALLDEHFNPLIRRLQSLRMPVIAAVNGTAAGAGANLALACDIAIAARSASFIQAFVKIGLVPDSGGTWLLPQRVGAARALGLAMTGDRLNATGGKLGAHLAGRRRRATAAGRGAARGASRAAANARACRDPQRVARRHDEHARPAARSRTRSAT
jgi:2-(1,2-epoxy-1,2-dihydrophenyl)acetyl-CoA isomerase